MPSIKHKQVYDRALIRIDDIKLAYMIKEDFYDSLNIWLHTFVSKPKFRRRFSMFKIIDETMDIEFELADPIDNEYDCEFVASILAKGLILSYFPQKLEQSSYLNAIVYGGDEKWKDNYKNAQARLAVLEKEVDLELSQHSYYFGNYNSNFKSFSSIVNDDSSQSTNNSNNNGNYYALGEHESEYNRNNHRDDNDPHHINP